MTSHYRHRRLTNPATTFPPLEPGEIASNTANRQLAIGDAATGAAGAPLMLIAVRFFDARAQYGIGDFAVQGGQLYRAIAASAPGAFNAANWEQLSTDNQLKSYVDAGDAAVTSAFQAADAALQTNVNGKVNKSGDTLTGMLTLPATPPSAQQATTRQYVDNAISAATGGIGSSADDISNLPAGNISATNVQAAINELDAEKAPVNGAALANPTATTPAANDNSTKVATTAYVLGQGSASSPAMDGVPAPGTAPVWARGDHVHPTDTSRAPLDAPDFTGIPQAQTAAVGTNTRQLATCAFVLAQPVNTIANGIVTFIKMASSALATGPEFIANAAQKILTANAVWAAAVPVTLTEAGAVATPDFALGIDFIWNMGGAGRTLANPQNMKLGQKGVIYLKQPAAGGATITTWGTAYKFPNNGVKPVPTNAANALDILTYIVKSAAEIECTFIGNMG